MHSFWLKYSLNFKAFESRLNRSLRILRLGIHGRKNHKSANENSPRQPEAAESFFLFFHVIFYFVEVNYFQLIFPFFTSAKKSKNNQKRQSDVNFQMRVFFLRKHRVWVVLFSWRFFKSLDFQDFSSSRKFSFYFFVFDILLPKTWWTIAIWKIWTIYYK